MSPGEILLATVVLIIALPMGYDLFVNRSGPTVTGACLVCGTPTYCNEVCCSEECALVTMQTSDYSSCATCDGGGCRDCQD